MLQIRSQIRVSPPRGQIHPNTAQVLTDTQGISFDSGVRLNKIQIRTDTHRIFLDSVLDLVYFVNMLKYGGYTCQIHTQIYVSPVRASNTSEYDSNTHRYTAYFLHISLGYWRIIAEISCLIW